MEMQGLHSTGMARPFSFEAVCMSTQNRISTHAIIQRFCAAAGMAEQAVHGSSECK